jgi:ribosomal protein L40E
MEILGIPIALVAFWVVYILYKSVGEKQIFGDRCIECQSVLNEGATRCAKCGSSVASFQNETQLASASGVEPTQKTCPACISQVPFIASKCKFCGTDLVVEDLSHIKRAFEETERKEREAENLKRRAEEDALRLQQERTAFEHSEKERLQKEHFESLSPFKRFLILKKIPITLVLTSSLIVVLATPKALESYEKNQVLQQARQEAASEKARDQATAALTADKDIAVLEDKYCELFNSALQDPEFRTFISNSESREAESDSPINQTLVALTLVYADYGQLGLALGPEREKYLSAILELHMTLTDRDKDTAEIILQCSRY